MGFPSEQDVQAVLVSRLTNKLCDIEKSGNQKITLCLGYSVALLSLIMDHLEFADEAGRAAETREAAEQDTRLGGLRRLSEEMKQSSGGRLPGDEGVEWKGVDACVCQWKLYKYMRNRLAHFSHEDGGFSIKDDVDRLRGFCIVGPWTRGRAEKWTLVINRRHLTRILKTLSDRYIDALTSDRATEANMSKLDCRVARIETGA